MYTWGKGDSYRLGQGQTEEHVRQPRLVSGLQGHLVTHLSIGLTHAVATTREGKLLGWGK